MEIGFKYNGVCFLQNYFANSNIIRTFAVTKINDCMRCFEHNTLILTPPQKANGLIRLESFENQLCPHIECGACDLFSFEGMRSFISAAWCNSTIV